MREIGGNILFSASDLMRFMGCAHATTLDLMRLRGDPKQGVSQADVYQLMAYGRLYECPNVVLLYPHHGDLPPDPIRCRYSIAQRGADETLIVATHDLAGTQGDQRESLRQLVVNSLVFGASRVDAVDHEVV